MLVCEEEELEFWGKREEQIKEFLDETRYLPLPEDIEGDLKRKLKDEMLVCAEQKNQILNSDN